MALRLTSTASAAPASGSSRPPSALTYPIKRLDRFLEQLPRRLGRLDVASSLAAGAPVQLIATERMQLRFHLLGDVVLVCVHQLLARDPLGLNAQLRVAAQEFPEQAGILDGIELSQCRALSATHTATRSAGTVAAA